MQAGFARVGIFDQLHAQRHSDSLSFLPVHGYFSFFECRFLLVFWRAVK